MRYSHVFSEPDPTIVALRDLRTQLAASREATARVFASGGAKAPSVRPTRPGIPAVVKRSAPDLPRLTSAYRRLYAATSELLSTTPRDERWKALVSSVKAQLDAVGRAEPECSPPWYRWDDDAERVLRAFRDLELAVSTLLRYTWGTPEWKSWERSTRTRLAACRVAG